jgi:hypothetical protein
MTQLRNAGFECNEDYKDSLTVEAKDGDVVVYKGIQKGKGQPWIVRCVDGPNVKWNK